MGVPPKFNVIKLPGMLDRHQLVMSILTRAYDFIHLDINTSISRFGKKRQSHCAFLDQVQVFCLIERMSGLLETATVDSDIVFETDKIDPWLRELIPATRRRQDARSRNLELAFFYHPSSDEVNASFHHRMIIYRVTIMESWCHCHVTRC